MTPREKTLVGALLGTLGLGGGTAGTLTAVEEFRFWAPRGAVEELAGDVARDLYPLAIDRQRFRLEKAERELADCEAEPEGRCWGERVALREAEDALARLEARRAAYGE